MLLSVLELATKLHLTCATHLYGLLFFFFLETEDYKLLDVFWSPDVFRDQRRKERRFSAQRLRPGQSKANVSHLDTWKIIACAWVLKARWKRTISFLVFFFKNKQIVLLFNRRLLANVPHPTQITCANTDFFQHSDVVWVMSWRHRLRKARNVIVVMTSFLWGRATLTSELLFWTSAWATEGR